MEENFFGDIKGAKKSGLIFTFLIFLYVILSFILGAVLQLLFDKTSFVFYLLSSFIPILSIFITLYLFISKSKEKVFSAINVKKFDSIFIIFSVILSFGMILGLGKLNDYFTEFLNSLGFNVNNPDITVSNFYEYILAVLIIGLLVAIFEECFFRGLFINSLKNTGKVFTCIFCGLFFSLYHASFAQSIYQFIYGVLLSLLVIKSKSVIPSIISHFLNNFIVLTTNYFNVDLHLNSPIIIVLGILLIIFFILFLCLYKKNSEKEEIIKGEKLKLFFPYGFMGLIILIILTLSGAI